MKQRVQNITSLDSHLECGIQFPTNISLSTRKYTNKHIYSINYSLVFNYLTKSYRYTATIN